MCIVYLQTSLIEHRAPSIVFLRKNYSSMITRKRVVYSKEFVGEIQLTDFEIKTDEMSTDLSDNGAY